MHTHHRFAWEVTKVQSPLGRLCSQKSEIYQCLIFPNTLLTFTLRIWQYVSSRIPDTWQYNPDKLRVCWWWKEKIMFPLVLHPVVDLDQEGMGRHCPGRSRAKGVGPYHSGAANHCTASPASFHPKWGGWVWFKLISAATAAEKRYGVCSSFHLQPHIPAYASTRAPETP